MGVKRIKTDKPDFLELITCLGFDASGELIYLVINGTAFGHQLTDLSISVHHGRVIAAAESLADLWK